MFRHFGVDDPDEEDFHERYDEILGPAFAVQIVKDGVSAGLNSVESLLKAREEGRLARKSDIYGAPKKRKPKKAD